MLTHAIIEIMNRQAVDVGRGLPAQFVVQFNPAQLSIQRGANYSETKEGFQPVLQFTGMKSATMTLDLFFDTTDFGFGAGAVDVRSLTRSFEQLVLVQPRTHAPPELRLTWGQGLSFRGVANSLKQDFTLFAASGVPVRSQVSISLQEYKNPKDARAETNLQSPDHTRTLTVKQGDTLHGIAFSEYGSCAHWRVIADANARNIVNPRDLVPGQVLTLPRLPGGH